MALFSFILVIALCAMAVAQQTEAVCDSSFTWMFNAQAQSPCVVASSLLALCSSTQTWDVPKLNGSNTYASPSMAEANNCQCSTVTFSLLMACALCQHHGVMSFVEWTKNCTAKDISLKIFPIAHNDVAVPSWATLDTTNSGDFDLNAAKQLLGIPISESWPVRDIILVSLGIASAFFIIFLAIFCYIRRHRVVAYIRKKRNPHTFAPLSPTRARRHTGYQQARLGRGWFDRLFHGVPRVRRKDSRLPIDLDAGNSIGTDLLAGQSGDYSNLSVRSHAGAAVDTPDPLAVSFPPAPTVYPYASAAPTHPHYLPPPAPPHPAASQLSLVPSVAPTTHGRNGSVVSLNTAPPPRTTGLGFGFQLGPASPLFNRPKNVVNKKPGSRIDLLGDDSDSTPQPQPQRTSPPILPPPPSQARSAAPPSSQSRAPVAPPLASPPLAAPPQQRTPPARVPLTPQEASDVLLISHHPGINFEVESTTDASSEAGHAVARAHTPAVGPPPITSRGDPRLLVPSSVRAAGYDPYAAPARGWPGVYGGQ